LAKDWGRSDDDQRHRLVVSGSVNTPAGPARTLWELLTHGYRVSGMLQAYSSLPFNITSGITTVQGTAGRPIVNGAFIDRNAGVGSDYVSLNMKIARSFALGAGPRVEAAVEGFNVTNRRNVVTRNTNFGAGAFPTNPSPTFSQPTAVADARSFQFSLRLRF
jgi:hypothetical protein